MDWETRMKIISKISLVLFLLNDNLLGGYYFENNNPLKVHWIIKTTACIQNELITQKLITDLKQKSMVWWVYNNC